MSTVTPIRKIAVLTIESPVHDLEPLGIVAASNKEYGLKLEDAVSDLEMRLAGQALHKYPSATLVCNTVILHFKDDKHGGTWYEATADVYGRHL